MKKVEILKDPDGRERRDFICPGCNGYHAVTVKGGQSPGPVWGYNWNDEKPTFTPSLLVRWVSVPKIFEKDSSGKYVLDPKGRIKGAKDQICHSFITDGKIQFLSDCTHKLKGQTVELDNIKK
jgi:hypothetical protein